MFRFIVIIANELCRMCEIIFNDVCRINLDTMIRNMHSENNSLFQRFIIPRMRQRFAIVDFL